MDLAAAAANSSSALSQPGTLGFIVVFGMGVILYFVFRSLTKHLRKINEAARIEAAQADAAQADTTQADWAQGDWAHGDWAQSAAGQDSAGPAPTGK